MNVKYNKKEGDLSIYVYGELDEYTVSKAREMMDKVLLDNLNAKKIVFDLSGLTFMDSTGIGLLIGRYKKIKQFNIPSYISGATFSVEKVIELSGLYKIMPKF